MANMERVRDKVTGTLSPEYLRQRTEAGWELIAMEWQRPAPGAGPASAPAGEEIPFGSRVSTDCIRLEDNPDEMDALTLILELIVQDRSLSTMAETLNGRGFRTREGLPWSVVSVYNMLPRLIEVSPRIFDTEAWIERRKHIPVGG